MTEKRVLFIMKERVVYGTKTKCYGLFNSCDFIARTLKEKFNIESKVVQVVDNNCIDKEVTKFKPTHCFIEALWVVPSKFEILSQLHPNVKWFVRLHSMVPFLASEGIAFTWINDYLELNDRCINVNVSVNNEEMYRDIVRWDRRITYSPNIYNPDVSVVSEVPPHTYKSDGVLHVGCFGALRILKNHTQQAFWAMNFADFIGKTLYFHVNVSEHEQKEAGPVLKNLREIFHHTNHFLIEHLWYNHVDFIALVKQMDLGMQLSFSETFNIVAADFVNNDIPIVVSDEIKFVSPMFRVGTSDKIGVFIAMTFAYCGRLFGLQRINKWLLNRHNKKSIEQWRELLNKH